MASVEEVLALMTKEYENAPRFSNWQPPDGAYIDLLTKVETRFLGEGSAAKPATILTGQIIDGEYKGRDHTIGFFIPATFGMMDEAYLNMGGEPINDPSKVVVFFREHIGDALAIEVSTRTDKQGVKRVGAKIVGVVPSQDADEGAGGPIDPLPEDEPEPEAPIEEEV